MDVQPVQSPTPQVTTMRAVVQARYGEAHEVLRLGRVAVPSVPDDGVLVRVHSAGVDRGAWHLMAGVPYPVRLSGFGVRRPKAPVRGREFAGTVVAVGEACGGFAGGDEVFGIAEGCFAEFVAATPAKTRRKPESLTFEQAAALPISGITALQAIRDKGKVGTGTKVLIIGASGGVGTFAVQIAKAMGAHVTGVCSTAKVDLVRSIGADHVIDYTESDIDDGGVRYDVIIDTGGNRTLRQLRRALEPEGTLVVVGGETDGRILAGVDRQLRALLLSPLVSQTLTAVVAAEDGIHLDALIDLANAGSVTPVLDTAYPLDETAAAITHMQEGRARGKVVVTI